MRKKMIDLAFRIGYNVGRLGTRPWIPRIWTSTITTAYYAGYVKGKASNV